jgi:hypothetical protein
MASRTITYTPEAAGTLVDAALASGRIEPDMEPAWRNSCQIVPETVASYLEEAPMHTITRTVPRELADSIDAAVSAGAIPENEHGAWMRLAKHSPSGTTDMLERLADRHLLDEHERQMDERAGRTDGQLHYSDDPELAAYERQMDERAGRPVDARLGITR